LIISVSSDQGSNWQRVLSLGENGQGIFVTGTIFPNNFVPTSSSSWCTNSNTGPDCFNLDLSAFDGSQDVRVRFETYNSGGSNIYLDNLKVSGICSNPITVNPLANFIIEQDTLCANSTILFYNASNNAKFMKLLKSRLANQTLLDGEYLHSRCCGHIINLVVKDGLSKVKKDVTNLRALVRSLGYPQRLEKFEERVEEFLIPHDPEYAKKARPKMDVLTRWNCTLEMIESSLPYVQIFSMMGNEEIDIEILDKDTGEVKLNSKTNLPITKSKKYKVSAEGWNKMKVLGEFLEPMRDATRW
jgi:hypothetical protein